MVIESDFGQRLACNGRADLLSEIHSKIIRISEAVGLSTEDTKLDTRLLCDRAVGQARKPKVSTDFLIAKLYFDILMKTAIIINDLPSRQNNHQHVEN